MNGTDSQAVAEGKTNDVVGNYRARIGIGKVRSTRRRADMHAGLAAVPATASNNDVFRYKRGVQRTSSVAEDAHFHSAIGRHAVYQIALHGHVGAAGDAETVGPIAGNRSVVHNPGILHLGIGAAGSRVGISRPGVVAGASNETGR